MQAYPEIKRFVQQTLGCSCPEEVFSQIDYQEQCAAIAGRKINVGGRLLIYIITLDGRSGIEKVISSALQQGVDERDKKGLNRFRLVLVTAAPHELCGLANRDVAVQRVATCRPHLPSPH